MAIKKVLISVKTYPTFSSKYEELVCTAGFLENGDWIRIYPVPFRKMPYHQQYKKYDWIEADLVKNTSDFRPESYRPRKIDADISIVGHIGTRNNWDERKKIVLQNVFTDLSELINKAKNKNDKSSLAVFKPNMVKDLIIKEVDRDWSKEKKEKLNQLNLFESTEKQFQIVRKLPYKFSYYFVDVKGKESTLMIEDWEIGQLFWKQLKKYDGDEKAACEDVREKYLNDFAGTKDLYLYLGTTYQNHFKAPNPFVIIGTFTPKVDKQLKLF